MSNWFYEENGQQHGPIKEADLRTMFANGLLPPVTRVWSAAFGNEWRPASSTDFALHLGTGPMPPPLTASSGGSPPPLAHADTPSVAQQPQAVPSDLYAWLLALSPLGFAVAEMMAYNPFDRGAVATVVPGVGAWLGLLLAWLDARNLNRSRRNPQQRTMVPFVLLTPIGYFWRRYAVTRASLKYLWIWIGCFFAYGVVVGSLIEG